MGGFSKLAALTDATVDGGNLAPRRIGCGII